MTGWLPRIARHGWTSCQSWGEAEGASLSVEWRGFVVEVAVARRDDVPRFDWHRLGRAARAALLTLALIAYLLVDLAFATGAWGEP